LLKGRDRGPWTENDQIHGEPEPRFQVELQAGTRKQWHGRFGLDQQVKVATTSLVVETRPKQIGGRRSAGMLGDGAQHSVNLVGR
jgi:hypothetical protein